MCSDVPSYVLGSAGGLPTSSIPNQLKPGCLGSRVYGVLPSIFQPGLPRWTSRCFCQISIHRGVSLGGRPPTESCSTHCAERAYAGRKPGYTRDRFNEVRDMLRQEAVSIAQIARETGLTRQTVYRIKGNPAGAETAWFAWGMRGAVCRELHAHCIRGRSPQSCAANIVASSAPQMTSVLTGFWTQRTFACRNGISPASSAVMKTNGI